jgi:hypothetical protein
LELLIGGSSLSRFVTPTRSSFRFPAPSASKAAIANQPTEIREAKTYETTCWWCGQTVFYHTNGHGDCVLFDSLGGPWEVHDCWTAYWKGQKSLRQNETRSAFATEIIARIEQYERSGQTSAYRNLGNRPAKSTFSQQRMAVLAGAISQSRFIPDELTVARLLGISLEQLKSSYDDLYTIDRSTNSIRLLSIDELGEGKEKAKELPSPKKPPSAKKPPSPKKPTPAVVIARPRKPVSQPKKRKHPNPQKQQGSSSSIEVWRARPPKSASKSKQGKGTGR